MKADSPTDLPVQIGPYEVETTLGQGYGGTVYLARGPDDRHVALKLGRGHTDTFDLLLEAQALKEVDHPSVVRVVADGLFEGRPWYAMSHIEGPTLRDVLNEHPDGLPIEQVRKLACAVCRPLGHLHTRGLVHRDLKPENIFVVDEDTVVLVDLGLAGRFGSRGRERMERGGRQVGSPAYMAPEQIRGRFVDARADLYALGCVLYELLAGRPPFGNDRNALRRHLRSEALALSEVRHDVPPEIDEVVQSMLRKQPADRVGYADDVARALGTGHGNFDSSSSVHYLYRSDLVGRRRYLEQSQIHIDAALAGAHNLVLVTGESGVGKTRLCSELGDLASRAGLQIWLGQASDPSLGASTTPLGLFDECFLTIRQSLLRSRSGVDAYFRTPANAACAAALVPQFEELRELVGKPPSQMGPRDVRQAGLTALVGAIRRVVEDEPACLMLDDLQWADSLSLELLAGLASDGAGGGLIILGAYRMEEGHERLADLRPHASVWELDRLPPDALSEMIGGMLAVQSPPSQLVDYIAAQSSGNPFFVAEFLQMAMQTGALVRREGRWQFHQAGPDISLPLSSTLSTLVADRLARISHAGRHLAAVGSVLGRTAPVNLLLRVASVDAQDALRTLEHLRVSQIVEFDNEGALSFVHDQIRQAAYPERGTAIRLHGRAADELSQHYDDAPEHAATIAEHFAKGDRPAEASQAYLTASKYARGRYLPDEALSCAECSLAQAKLAPSLEAPITDSINEHLFDLCLSNGRIEQALNSLAHAPVSSDVLVRARWLRKTATAHRTAHRYDRALAIYSQAFETLRLERGEEVVQEGLQIQMGRVAALYWTGRDEEREATIEAIAPEIAERLPASAQVRFYQGLVQNGVRKERFQPSEETLQYALRVTEISEHAEDESTLLEARFGLGVAKLWAGRIAEAATVLEQVEHTARRRGDRPLALRCAAYAGTAARQLGDQARAKAFAEQTRTAATELGLSDYLGLANAHLAWASWRTGDTEQALMLVQSALTAWATLPMTYPFTWCARLVAIAITPEDATQNIEALLSPAQQRLPDALEDALRGGVVSTIVEVARSTGHL